MGKSNKKYWQDRFLAVEDMMNKKSRTAVQSVIPAFDRAESTISKEIEAWYQRFADNNQVSLQEAKKILNNKELAELKWDVNEYIKQAKAHGLDPNWIKKLENASDKFHISRLEALKIHTQQASELAFGNEVDQIDKLISKIYTEDYYHTAYEIQKGIGVGWEIGKIDENRLSKIMEKPWTLDKQTFSDRIWKSKIQLLDAVDKELTQMCILGKSPDQAIENISNSLNVSKSQAGRLVMTESAYFASKAQKDCFTDLDVEQYEIVATLDHKTSAICQQMDGQVFKMSEYEAGVTAPPFHPWCRTTTVPYFEDFNEGATRAARGADGKTYQVPSDMKYEDWKKTFVNPKESPENTLKQVKVEDIVKSDGSIQKSETRQALERLGVDYREPKKIEKSLNSEEIAEKICGGDMTKGSCSSCAFAYVGNRSGLDVLDFRGGKSQDVFSSMKYIKDIASFDGVESTIIAEYNEFKGVNALLKSVVQGKEYYLATGKHAAIIRKLEDGFEYLELQSAYSNGFKKLNTDVLKRRFGCKKQHTVAGMKYKTQNVLIDVESLTRNEEFKQILGYINTAVDSQMKGASGHVK